MVLDRKLLGDINKAGDFMNERLEDSH